MNTSIEVITRAIASIKPLTDGAKLAINEITGKLHRVPTPVMDLSAKGLRRRLARQPAMSPNVQTGRQHRRVPVKVVTEVLRKRTPATRSAAVQAWVDFGSVPKAKRPSYQRRPKQASYGHAPGTVPSTLETPGRS